MKILQRLSFRHESSKQGRFVWKTSAFEAVKGTAKPALPSWQRPKCGIFVFVRTKRPEFQKDGFSGVRFPVSSRAFSS